MAGLRWVPGCSTRAQEEHPSHSDLQGAAVPLPAPAKACPKLSRPRPLQTPPARRYRKTHPNPNPNPNQVLQDGSAHAVDSSEIAFRFAAQGVGVAVLRRSRVQTARVGIGDCGAVAIVVVQGIPRLAAIRVINRRALWRRG